MNKKIFNLTAIIFCMLGSVLISNVQATKIYWTDSGYDRIQRANPDGTNIENLVTTGLSKPSGIAVDLSSGKMYWTDNAYNRIQQANLDGSNVQSIVTGLIGPYGIALDVTGGKMYWAEGRADKICRANLDGSNIETLVSTGLSDPYHIALDLTAGKIYWTDYGTDRIQRANLDGSNVEILVSTGLMVPYGIALDVAGGKMYWTDCGYNRIQRANLDGSNIETLVSTGLQTPIGIALDLTGGKMYWAEYDTNKIQRANPDGSNVQDIVTGLGDPSGIAIPQTLDLDDLQIRPWDNLVSSGPIYYGPFTPECASYTLTNTGPNTIIWSADWTADWLDVTPDAGTLTGGASATVQICINSDARYLEPGFYNAHVMFSNASSGAEQARYVELTVQHEQAKLLALDGAYRDNFGWSVSIDGDYAVIGAYRDDDNGTDSGSAYIFKRDGTAWSQQAKLKASDGRRDDYFGKNVSIDGDYAIVGAHYDDDNGTDSGSAYIFKRDGTAWSQQAKLLASDGNTYDLFGNSVSIDGECAIVGAYGNDDYGSAYIFKRKSGTWVQQAKLLPFDGAYRDNFGWSVSIDGDYAVIGAYRDDDNGTDSGSAYIFKRDGTGWMQQAKLKASDGRRDDWFGYSVSIDGECCIIGAYRDDDNGSESGSAYIFKRDGETWSQKDKLTPSDGYDDNLFGFSVSIDGEYCIIGAYLDDDNGSGSGSAYIFKRDGMAWNQKDKLTPSDGFGSDYFGYSVSIDGECAIVGAYGDDDNSSGSGSAYIFSVFKTGPVACIVGGDRAVEADSNCEGRVVLDGSCSSDADSTPGTNDDINDFDWYVVDACDPNYEDYLGSGEVIECNLPLGENIIVLEVTDAAGAFDSNEVTITVEDVTGPEFSLVVEPNVLWPPNHKMVLITVEWEVSDNCDDEPEVRLVSITSSEDDDGKGDGATSDDIVIGEDGSIYLRAESLGYLEGRVYTITYEAVDDSGNATVGSVEVLVPDGYRWRHLEHKREREGAKK